MFGELNEIAILIEEVREAVNEIKSSTAPGLNGFPVVFKKMWYGSMAVLDWLASKTIERKF